MVLSHDIHALRGLLAAAAALLLACTPSAAKPPDDGSTPPDVSVGSGSSGGAHGTPKRTDVEGAETLFVDAELVDCEGEGPMKCMRVRKSEADEWELMYSPIDGFVHEAGNAYELRVTKHDVKNPPADASSIRTVLVEVVSKTPVAAPPSP